MADDDHWDEHADLLALLHDDGDVPLDATALVDRLGPAFAAHRRQARDYIRHAFIPVVHHTHQLHDAIQNDIFPSRAQGLASFDDVSRRFENAASCDMDTAQSVYSDAKCSLDVLFSTLDDIVCQSNLLFQAFKMSMLEHVQRLRLCANQMPVDAERLMSTLENKAKHLGAEDHAKAKESLLRGILEKY